MRLLYVIHQYRPALGGAEKLVTDLAEAMAQRGHEVTVFTSRALDYRTWRTADLPAREVLAGVQVNRFVAWERGPHTWQMLEFGIQHYWKTRFNRYAPFIIIGNGPMCPGLVMAMLTRKWQFDLVHVHNLHYATMALSYWAARITHLPYVLSPLIHIDQPQIFEIGFQLEILRQADFVLAMTRAEADYLRHHQIPSHQLSITGGGLDLTRYPIHESAECRQTLELPLDALVILFLARKERYKGLPVTLEAFAQLMVNYPNVWLVAAGPETDDSRTLRLQYATVPRIIYFDGVSDEVKVKLLNSADVFMLPSEGESFGIVYLEAWAYAKPVIAARSGAIPSLITDWEDGLLIAPGNVAQAIQALQQLITNPELRRTLGERGRAKLLRHYTIERVTDKTEAAYTRALRIRRTRR